MRISIKSLIVSVVVLITFFPYGWIANSLDVSVAAMTSGAQLLLQLGCVAILLRCFLVTESRSLRLFWQYGALAALGMLFNPVMLLISGSDNLLTVQLSKDFISLFVFFFLLLAVETNPHLSSLPLKKYITGTVPAVFFTVICFGYFVLLPAELAESVYRTGKPSLLFALLIGGLIFCRLLVCLLRSQQRFWRQSFAGLLLACGFGLLHLWQAFITVGSADIQSASLAAHTYGSALLTLLPYTAVLVTCSFSLTGSVFTKSQLQPSDPERYIILLMIVLTGFHLYGHEKDLFYAVATPLQSVVVALWLVMGTFILLMIAQQRKSYISNLRQTVLSDQQQQLALQTQNAQLNNSLINSEDKAIVRVSNNAILTTTVTGEILSANPAAVQMFQILEHELIGTNVSRLFAEKDEMQLFFSFQSNVYALQRKEKGISMECMSLRSDGNEFPAQAEMQWAERQDQPLIVLTFINLTARKLAEKQTLELKDKFIANISHEFRTPLTIINGIIDRYLSKSEKEEAVRDLNTAKRNGIRLVRMVEQLLELSRLRDNPSLKMSHFRLNNLMAMPIDSFSRLATQHQLSFSSSVPTDLWIECDAQAFEKVIYNLLANAVKYTPAGGDIKVNAYAEHDTVIIDVIDSGIGINKLSQAKIFERFARADDPLNQNTFGVGIGLSLVNELVKAHGWRISLVSEQGQGSKFSLSIPLSLPQAIESQLPMGLTEHELASVLVEQRSVTSIQAKHSQQVVLVIEDNLDMQSHIKQVIEQHHHVILAGNGELGVELAQEYVPDLIVTDLMLPGIDGFEVLKQVKQHEVTAHIPVILLTARSDLDSRLEGLHLNADEYLSKPFNQHELLTRIQNLIDNRKQLQRTFLKNHEQIQQVKRKQTSQENVAKLADDGSESSSLDEKFLAKLEALVAQFYAEPSLDIFQLADKLAMSERQLQRKIKVLLGTNPNNFIREFRLKKAQELLRGGTQVGIVAFDVGFSSQTYFGRCFKEVYGCTPKQYQQQCQEGGVNATHS